MLLLLDLTLQEVDATKELCLSLNWLSIAEPERVHLNFLEFQITLATIIRADEGDLV